jgi:hypothetical protein
MGEEEEDWARVTVISSLKIVLPKYIELKSELPFRPITFSLNVLFQYFFAVAL